MRNRHLVIFGAVGAAMCVTAAYAQGGAGTQPPAGNNPDRICVYDSGANPPIGWRIVPAGTASSLPHGVATDGQPTQLNATGGCDTDTATPAPVQATGTPQATAAVPTGTPVPGATSTPTAAPTDTPTPAPTDTPVPTATPAATDTPTPLPLCARDGCVPEVSEQGK